MLNMIDVTSLNLPINQITSEIHSCLAKSDQLILEAPPGAGKTTVVPLSILNHQTHQSNSKNWLKDQKIIMLEPRRIAARNAAIRMASLLGEKVGETIGYRMRGETKVSAKTRIEVVTQGVLTRMMQNDPELESVGAIIFDEFHERQLDSDLALSLCQYTNQLFREDNPIKLIVMSATLEKMPIDQVLTQAETLHCEGKCYPVDVIYRPIQQPQKPNNTLYNQRARAQQLIAHTAETTLEALSLHSGSVLVFLPGIKEIKLCQTALETQLKNDSSILIAPLYGGLSPQAQQDAIQPCADGARKVVLTTSIAETSLTIDGVSIVIDSGLSRFGIFDHSTGLSRLFTKPVSKATATQRTGRAGRLSKGICYRLWSEQAHYEKQEHSPPEIQQSDLTDTILQLSQMGVTPDELDWLDTPPQGHIQKAIERLKTFNALSKESNPQNLITTGRGNKIAVLPVPALIASLLLGCEQHKPKALKTAIQLAALIQDGDILFSGSNSISSDITLRLKALREKPKREYPAHSATIDALLRHYKNQTERDTDLASSNPYIDERKIGELCALALPHRIAKKVKQDSQEYKLASGEAVTLHENDPMRKYEWLVVLDVFIRNINTNTQNQPDVIRMAAPLSKESLLNEQGLLSSINLLKKQVDIGWQDGNEQLIAKQSLKIGRLTVSEEKLDNLTPEIKLNALLNWIKESELNCLPWDEKTLSLQTRVKLINEAGANSLPDLSQEVLLETLNDWLAPYLNNITRQKQLDKLPLYQILIDQLTWQQQQTLEQLAPTHITAPSGSKVAIDYTQTPPVMAVKLQEMFGCTETPKINNGKTALMVHLLSPARRPLQITQDLTSFWKNGYQEVKKENKAKYAKHPWPDDPMQATATRFTNRKLRER